MRSHVDGTRAIAADCFPRRFSLKVLIGVTIACGTAFGLLGNAVRTWSQQRSVAEHFEQRGGAVQLSFVPSRFGMYVTSIDLRRGAFLPERRSAEWSLLRSPDFAQGPLVSDRDLEVVMRCECLQALGLSGANISDSGVMDIGALKHLLRLDLSGTRITDRGLVGISSLPSLVELNLSGTLVSDEGLSNLYGLTNLTVLKLNACSITDRSVRTISKLATLRRLEVVDSGIDDADLAKIRKALPNVDIIHDRASYISEHGSF